MPRYLVRRGNTGRGWVVWDRVKRGPAVVAGRELARLSREDAYAAVALLNGPSFDRNQQDRSHKLCREANGGAQCGKSARCVRRGGGVPMPSAWQVNYSGITVDCR